MKKFMLGSLVIVGSFFTITAAENMVACTMEYAPVCAQPPMPTCPTGMACIQVMPAPQTYGNKCAMNAAKAEFLYDGECDAVVEDTAPVVCTEEYAPVCGEVEVQCVKAPCPPIKKTYGNRCLLRAEKANALYAGSCLSTVNPNPAVEIIAEKADHIFFATGKTFEDRYLQITAIITKMQETRIVSLMTPKQSQLRDLVEEAFHIYLKKHVINRMIKENISTLTKDQPKLGGKRSVTAIKREDLDTAIVFYEDGHIQGKLEITFENINSKITYKVRQLP